MPGSGAAATSATKLLQGDNIKWLIQGSYSAQSFTDNYCTPAENGFVRAAVHAYSDHHHLTILPEDVWFAILVQLSSYIVAHAEELRSHFVAHEGKKRLVAHAVGNIDDVDFGPFFKQLAGMIGDYVLDPGLPSWAMPSFSTTTETDKVVGSVLFMGAMQEYFSYGVSLTCGIPSVTLFGELSDWKGIRSRLDNKVLTLSNELQEFRSMLVPILDSFILSFEKPNSKVVKDFWNTIATVEPRDSGADWIEGWITAFCFWNKQSHPRERYNEVSSMGGVTYPGMCMDMIPVGYSTVPVDVIDNGVMYDCEILVDFQTSQNWLATQVPH